MVENRKACPGYKSEIVKNGLKPQIQRILERHRGRGNPIGRRELIHALELTPRQDRKVRLLIGELRHEGLPVLFATNAPAGYYLPESLNELKTGMDKLRSYIIDECIVLRDLKVRGAQYLAGESQGVLL